MIDGYHKWLGIPKDQRPPTYYQLLGIAPDETDTEVIEAAAIRQVAFVRNFQTGPHAEQCSRLLTELAEARLTLLNPEKRVKYDARLGIAKTSGVPPAPAPSNRSGDELAKLSSLLTEVRTEPTLGIASGKRAGRGAERKGWSSLTLALQCAITGFTLVAAYYLLNRWPKAPAPPAASGPRVGTSTAVSEKPAILAAGEVAEKATPAPAELDIRLSPPQVKLKLEGLEAETVASHDGGHRYRLSGADGAGTVRVRATLAGYRAVEKTLTPAPGERQTLALILVPEGSTEESTARLGSVVHLPPIPAPAWAEFRVHLKPVPRSVAAEASGLKSKLYRVERGVYLYQIAAPDGHSPIKFRYSAPGFKPLETSLTPQPGERKELIFHLAPAGSTDESRVVPSDDVPASAIEVPKPRESLHGAGL
jgi:hypothetical protein